MRVCDLYNIDDDTELKAIKINSKEVNEGDIFVCVSGVTADRHDFIPEAIENGAKLLVVSKDVGEQPVSVIKVENTNKELISLARKFYDFHDEDLSLIGVTGTNGKTTISLMIQELLGEACGYMGTNGISSKSFKEQIRNTTPDADRLYLYFRRFIDDGCKYLSMETSSEAFFRNRLETLSFKVGIISNITQDHLNIHKTIENYVECKMGLLRKVREDGFAILNIDDKYYSLALENIKGKVLTYGKSVDATMRLIEVLDKINGSVVTFEYNDKSYSVDSPYLGEMNAYNLMASLLACISLGKDIEELLLKVPNLSVIPGRMQVIHKDKYSVVLDYAHTVDAFMKVLPILNKLKKNRLIVVTGSAGGREHEKRGPMGKYILENSDFVVFTMDDPRSENVLDIISDLTKDSSNTNYEIIEDRKDAIYHAFDIAEEGDIVLVAGKGVDNYMAIGNEYLPYSDFEVINEYFNN